MIWKQFKVFLHLKRKEIFSKYVLQRLKDGLKSLAYLLIITIVCFFSLSSICLVLGLLTSLIWSWPYDFMIRNDPTTYPAIVYIGIGTIEFFTAFCTVPILLAIGEWLKDNWDEAGRIVQNKKI